MEAQGYTGQVQFDGQYVTITRKGLRARVTVGKGEKRLHISQITAIQWKPAGPFVNGFMQFSMGGGNERRSTLGSQTSGAVSDENSVVFTKKQMPAFVELRTHLDDAIAQHPSPRAARVAGPSVADELSKLAQLRDQGIITAADFEAGKTKLLGI